MTKQDTFCHFEQNTRLQRIYSSAGWQLEQCNVETRTPVFPERDRAAHYNPVIGPHSEWVGQTSGQ